MEDTIEEAASRTPPAPVLPTDIARPVDLVRHPRNSSYGYLPQLIKVGLPILASDMAAVLIALCIGLQLTIIVGPEVNHFGAFVLLALPAYALSFWAAGLYPGVGLHPAHELKQLFRGGLCASLALEVGMLCIISLNAPYVRIIAFTFLLLPILIPGLRSLTKTLMRKFDFGVPFYFLGSRNDVLRVHREMSRFGWTKLRPAGRFSHDDEHDDSLENMYSQDFETRFERNVPYLGTPDILPRIAANNNVFWLFIVGDAPPLKSLFTSFPEVVWISPQRSQLCTGSSIMNYGLASGIRIEESLLLPLPRIQKRILDFSLAALALLVLSPLIAAIVLLIKLSSRGPILFCHERIGCGGVRFRAWKFRSMVPDAKQILARYLEAHPEYREEWEKNHKLKYDPRITWVGRLLRKTSLDELPQLWNVLIGDMSLVGPRPIVTEEIEKYGETFRDYLRVPPGITGLWQVSGRNNTSYAERLAYDEFYVQNWSLWLDIYIMMRTVRTVLMCEGAY